jgi:hypothetical protein
MDSAAVTRLVSAEALAQFAGKRVFFGHQSVGLNVISGLAPLYAAHGLPPLAVTEIGDPGAELAAGMNHAAVGRNREPDSKIADFEARIRGGLHRSAQVMMLKLCYVDVVAPAAAAGVFQRYQAMVSGLRRDYPDCVVLASTVPLTTDGGIAQWVVSRLARGAYDAAANLAREQFNALVREQNPGGLVFDIAAVESTAPDGTRCRSGSAYCLAREYAADSGHLNAEGSARAAAELVPVIAR